MTPQKTISIVLLAVAYFASAYLNTIVVLLPIVGSGVPVIERSGGHPQEAPRPVLAPRRHLPLVKLISFDQLTSATRHVRQNIDFRRLPVILWTPILHAQLLGFPSLGRAPPAA